MGGVLGTGHHTYWAGGPSMWVPLGSMFSFIEVLPLVLLIIEAIGQYRLIQAHQTFNIGRLHLHCFSQSATPSNRCPMTSSRRAVA